MEIILAGLAILTVIFVIVRVLVWACRLGFKAHDSQYKAQFIREHRLQEEALREYMKGR